MSIAKDGPNSAHPGESRDPGARVGSIRAFAGTSGNWRRAVLAYAIYAAAIAGVLWPALRSMADQWISSSSFHHAPLALPIALWLILRQRIGVAPAFYPPALVAVGLLLVAAFIGREADANIVQHLALIGLLIAGVIVIFGKTLARAWAFPLLFLFFLVPFGDSAQPMLQQMTAAASTILLHLVGVDAVRDGLLIATPIDRFIVAPSCAGLNFLLVALMISSLFAAIALDDWRRRLQFVALAAATALLANIIRVAFVIAADTWTKGAYNIAADHILFGWIFYVLMLALLIAFGRRLVAEKAAA